MERLSQLSSQASGYNMFSNSGTSQPEPSTQLYDDNFKTSTTYEAYSQDSFIEKAFFPSPWARLTSRAKGSISYELFMKSEKDDDLNRYNTHLIGRAKKCDIVVSSSGLMTTNVSNHHCRIYCKINYALVREQAAELAGSDDNYIIESKRSTSMHVYDLLVQYLSCLEVWIDDLSTNGTYVNGSMMPKKGSRQLHHGDMISLINPDIDPKSIVMSKGLAKHDFPSAIRLLQDEILSNSFDIMIFLPISLPKRLSNSGIGLPCIHSSLSHDVTIDHNQWNSQTVTSSCSNNNAEANPHADLRKSTTVFKLLHEERVFYDYYQTGRQMGVGGAAKVYEAINKDTGKKYAVKVFDYRHYVSNRVSVASAIALNGAEAAMYSILKEAELLRSLRHPHIIHLEDIFADDRYLYLVMELLRGGDLFDRLAKKRQYPEAEAKLLMRQTLEAIKYLHQNKVAHRDIKLENILLMSPTNDIDIKLTGA